MVLLQLCIAEQTAEADTVAAEHGARRRSGHERVLERGRDEAGVGRRGRAREGGGDGRAAQGANWEWTIFFLIFRHHLHPGSLVLISPIYKVFDTVRHLSRLYSMLEYMSAPLHTVELQIWHVTLKYASICRSFA